jgi:hypothetical protein
VTGARGRLRRARRARAQELRAARAQPRNPVADVSVRACRGFQGRRSRCRAGGNSMRNTAPESAVPRATSGAPGGRLRRPAGDDDLGRAVRVLFVGGGISYRALFNWISPGMYVATMLGAPLFQIFFFTYLGRYAGLAGRRVRPVPAADPRDRGGARDRERRRARRRGGSPPHRGADRAGVRSRRQSCRSGARRQPRFARSAAGRRDWKTA